jgi:hypothetical protein
VGEPTYVIGMVAVALVVPVPFPLFVTVTVNCMAWPGTTFPPVVLSVTVALRLGAVETVTVAADTGAGSLPPSVAAPTSALLLIVLAAAALLLTVTWYVTTQDAAVVTTSELRLTTVPLELLLCSEPQLLNEKVPTEPTGPLMESIRLTPLASPLPLLLMVVV